MNDTTKMAKLIRMVEEYSGRYCHCYFYLTLGNIGIGDIAHTQTMRINDKALELSFTVGDNFSLALTNLQKLIEKSIQSLRCRKQWTEIDTNDFNFLYCPYCGTEIK